MPIKELSDLDSVKYIIFDTPLAAKEVFSELGHVYSFLNNEYDTVFVRISNCTWAGFEYDISVFKEKLEKLQNIQATLLAKYAENLKKYTCKETLFACAYWFDDELKRTDNLSKCRFIYFKSEAYKDKFFKQYDKYIIYKEMFPSDLIYEIIDTDCNTQQWCSINYTRFELIEQNEQYVNILKTIINYKNEKEN